MNKIRIRTVDSFQHKVADWLRVCFGETVAADKRERNFRFLEEAVELDRISNIDVINRIREKQEGKPK